MLTAWCLVILTQYPVWCVLCKYSDNDNILVHHLSSARNCYIIHWYQHFSTRPNIRSDDVSHQIKNIVVFVPAARSTISLLSIVYLIMTCQTNPIKSLSQQDKSLCSPHYNLILSQYFQQQLPPLLSSTREDIFLTTPPAELPVHCGVQTVIGDKWEANVTVTVLSRSLW